MDENKKKEWKWILRFVAITIGACIGALLIFIVVLAGMEDYSRAEINPEQGQKAHHIAVRAHSEVNS